MALVFLTSLTTFAPATLAQEPLLQRVKQSGVQIKKLDRPQKVGTPLSNVVITVPVIYSDGTGAFIRWHTQRETNNLGFYVFRLDGKTRSQVGKFVGGSALRYGKETVFGEEYSTFDPKGRLSSQYFVESIEQSGRRTESSVAIVQKVDSLSSLAGKSSTEMIKSALTALPSAIVTNTDIAYSKDLLSDIRNNTPPPDPTAQRWVASQPGVRIGIKRTGLYRVTASQLQAAGFDTNTDPTNWQLYMNGVEQAINIGSNGSYVEFFGRGLDALESDTRIYYLVNGSTPGKRMASVMLRPALKTASLPSYSQDSLLKVRSTYISTLLNGPTSNFVGDVIILGGTPPVETFTLSSVDTAVPTARLIVKLLAFNKSLAHTIGLTLNGQSIGQVSNNGSQSFTFDAQVPTSDLVSGQNSLQLTALTSGDATFFDSVEVVYNRGFVADQNAVLFGLPNFYSTQVRGFSSPNIRMFDVSYDGTPVQIVGASIVADVATYKAIIPAYRERLMYGVEDSAIMQPFSITANAPSTLSTTNHNANLVIISYKDFMTQANAWADYRRSQGFSVEVVDVEDVFDEFNYGIVSAQSIKDFLFYAKNNWQTAPGYVLLIGKTTYDPRDYEGRGNINYMPTMMFDSLNEETASDDALVDFNNDGLAELAIGRIPAKTPDMVTTALNKTIGFEQNSTSQNLSRGTLFAYDAPNGYDFMGASQNIAGQLPAGTATVMEGRCDPNFPTFPCDPNAHTNIINTINGGPYLVNFAGHGTTGVWVNTSFYSINDAPQLANIDNLSIFTMLTCLNGYFIGTRNTSFAEVLLNSTTGGAVASWASTGTTTPDVQELMATRFYLKVGDGSIPRLGDLIVDAKTVVPGGRDVRLTWALLGDPMLKVR